MFEFDPNNWPDMLPLMEEYGDNDGLFVAANEYGERVVVSISPDIIIATTFQHNGWNRKNIYHADGTVEELYEK